MNNVSASNNPQTVNIADLNREHTQLRAVMDDAAVGSYADVYNNRKNGSDRMPPVTVYESQSGELYLVDGFHRVAAKEQLRQKTIPAIIEPGELDDAIVAAAKVNQSHNAVRWTNADKRNAAVVLVKRFPKLPTRELGDLAGCSHKLIGNVKRELKGEREAPKKGRVLKKPTRKPANQEAGEKLSEPTFPTDPTPDVQSAATTMVAAEADEPTDAEFTASIIDLMRQHLSDEHSTDQEIVTRWCGQYGQGGAA
ncbi:ParB N-terminal domain-containing protein [bacterium]|nr:ParB N-terminal domain-containing protein [bacterium]